MSCCVGHVAEIHSCDREEEEEDERVLESVSPVLNFYIICSPSRNLYLATRSSRISPVGSQPLEKTIFTPLSFPLTCLPPSPLSLRLLQLLTNCSVEDLATSLAPTEPEEKIEGATASRLEEPTTSETTINVKGVPFEIECLLMSGRRKRWTVGSEETVSDVRQRIFANFPQGELHFISIYLVPSSTTDCSSFVKPFCISTTEWRTSEAAVSSPDSIRL